MKKKSDLTFVNEVMNTVKNKADMSDLEELRVYIEKQIADGFTSSELLESGSPISSSIERKLKQIERDFIYALSEKAPTSQMERIVEILEQKADAADLEVLSERQKETARTETERTQVNLSQKLSSMESEIGDLTSSIQNMKSEFQMRIKEAQTHIGEECENLITLF